MILKQEVSLQLLFQVKMSPIYATIAENAGMKIANQYKRTVLNRTEKIIEQHNENI